MVQPQQKITKAMMLLRKGDEELDSPFVPSGGNTQSRTPVSRVQQMIQQKEEESKRNKIIAENSYNYVPPKRFSVKKNVFVGTNIPNNNTITNDKLSKSEIERMGGISKSMSNSPSLKNIAKLRKIQMSISSNDLNIKKTRNITPKLNKTNNIKAKRIVTADSNSVTQWIDSDNLNLTISSFVCRMIEIKHWIETILKIDVGLDDSNIHEFPDYLTNGILICKLAQHFDPSIKKVYTGTNTNGEIQYKMTNKRYNYIDNINEFLRFAHNIKLPNLFIFETNDLYMKKNIPKVIACLHALSHFMSMLNKAPLVTKLDNDKSGISAYFHSLNIGVDNLNRIKHLVGSDLSGRKYIDGFDEAIRVNVGDNINRLTLIKVDDEKIPDIKPSEKIQDTESEENQISTNTEEVQDIQINDEVFQPNDSFTFLTIDEESENSLTMSDVDNSFDNATVYVDKSIASVQESPLLNIPTLEDQYITRDARKLFNNIEYTSTLLPSSDSITAIQEKYKFMMDEEEMKILGNSVFAPLPIDYPVELNERDAVKLQSLCRGYISRFDLFVTKSMLKGNLQNITNFQSLCRGALLRRRIASKRRLSTCSSTTKTTPNFTSFQKDDEYGSSMTMRTILKNKAAHPHLLAHKSAIVELQSLIRGQDCRNSYKYLRKKLLLNMESVIKLQSVIRGISLRSDIQADKISVKKLRIRKQPPLPSPPRSPNNIPALSPTKPLKPYFDDDELFERFDIPDSSLPQQGHVPRRSETRKHDAKYIPNLPLEPTTPSKSRNISKMHHSPTKKDLKRILSPGSSTSLKPTVLFPSMSKKSDELLNKFEDLITDFNSIIRGNLVRSQYSRLRKELFENQNQIVTLQSTLRAIEKKLDYDLLVEDMEEFDDVIVPLQSSIRSYLLRKRLKDREEWFLRPDNYKKICKLQAIIKGLHHVSDYRALIEEKNPPFKAIKNFINVIGTLELENTSQKEVKILQLKQEIKNEKANVGTQLQRLAELRKKVDILKKFGIDIKNIQKDLKKNVDSGNAVLRHLVDVDDLVEVEDKKRISVKKDSDQLSLFVGTFFWILQNKPEYWSDVLNYFEITGDLIEFSSGNIEDWVLKCFNYADSNSQTKVEPTKEEGLLVKLIVETFKLFILRTPEKDFKSFVKKRRDFKNVNVKNWELLIHAYLNLPQQRNFTKSILGDALFLITGDDEASFECEPEAILAQLVDETDLVPLKYVDQYESGEIEALDIPIVKTVYVKNMQNLRASVFEIFQALKRNIDRIPLFIRVLLHELYELLKEVYQLSPNYTFCLVGSVFIHCYVLPILNSPSNFSIDIEAISNDSSVISRIYRNLELAVICLNQISTFKHFDPSNHPYLTSLDSFVDEIKDEMKDFISELIDVSSVDVAYRKVNLESDSLRTLKIQKNDVFELVDILGSFMHENCNDEQDVLYFCAKEIMQLDKKMALPVDSYGFTEIVLDDDENNEENTNLLIADLLLLEIKKYLIYIIQVQDGDNLIDMLVSEIQPADELKFKDIVKSEKKILKREKVDVSEIEIYNMSFPQVKKHALELIFELERLQVISHQDGYQQLLNDLASDIKNKRKQQQEMDLERETIIEILTELKRRVSTYKRTYDDYEKLIKLTLNEKAKQKVEIRESGMATKGNNSNIFQKLFSRSGRKMKKLKMKNSSAFSDALYGSHTMSVSSLIDKNVVSKAASNRASISISCDKIGFFLLTLKGIDTSNNRFNTSIDQLLDFVCKDEIGLDAFNGNVTFVSIGLLKLILNLYYE